MPIDYDKLAAAHGGTMAGVDYDALASAHGGSAGGEEQPSTRVEGSAASRFVRGAASNLNPLGALEALAHPIDTVENLINAHVEQAKKAKQAYDEGRYSEAVGHLGAAALPVLGPAAAAAGEKIGEGEDIAGGLGESVGLIGSVFTPKLVKGAAKATTAAGKAVAPILGKAAPAVVKHASTAAGAYLGGTPGAILGASVGEELAGRLRNAKAPVVVPEAVSALPERPVGPVEPPLEFSRRLKRQQMEAAGGEQAAKEAVYGPPEPPAAPQAQASAPAPVVAPAPAQPAAALSEGPQVKLLDPDYAKSPQRMKSELGIQARRLGVKLTDEQLDTGVEAIKQGARPDAVARQFAPLDPAAELAAKLGTPTPEMVAARVAERNRTGRWPGAPNGKQILARANPPN